MARQIIVKKHIKFPDKTMIKNRNSIFLRPVDQNEIKTTILSLKENTSPGLDKITTKIYLFI